MDVIIKVPGSPDAGIPLSLPHAFDQCVARATPPTTPNSNQGVELTELRDTDCQHVNHLPPELLVEVFVKYAELVRSPAMGWLKLRFVCHYWNEVACGTPSLWRDIHVLSNPSWLALCLTRSVSATLDITFRQVARYIPLEVLQTSLLPHAARMRSLTVDPHVPQQIIHDFLQPLLGHAMPALESVDLPPMFPSNLQLNLSHQRHPHVQNLFLRNVHHPVELRLLSHLRSLQLVACGPAFSASEFLDLLASSSRLEELLLGDTIHGFRASALRPPATSHSRKRIAMPRLVSLKVVDRAHPVTSTFLSYLCLPANAHVLLSSLDRAEGAAHTPRNLLPPAPYHTSFAPLLGPESMVTAVSSSFGSRYRMAAQQMDGSGGSFRLSNSAPTYSVGLEQGVLDILDVFGVVRLRHLNIQVHGDSSYSVTADVWGRLFAAFPALETFALCMKKRRGAQISSFWVALGGVGGGDAARDPAAPAIQCPGLSRLQLDGEWLVSDGLFPQMIECLERRGERGSRLRYLQPGHFVYGGDKHEANALDDTLCIPRLRALVDELVL